MKETGNSEFSLQNYKDHQMSLVKHLLVPHVQQIAKADNEQAALIKQFYLIQKQFLEDIVNKNWMSNDSKIAVIGGIMINCDEDVHDRFLPIHFEVRTLNDTEDLYETTFGQKSVTFL